MRNNHRNDEVQIRPFVEDLVINWHLIEACNYSCKYCYAAWEKPGTSKELHRDQDGTAHLLTSLYDFFRPSNSANPLAQVMDWKNVRLSIAGGEPTLLKERLDFVISKAKQLGFKVSLITNGSLLDAQRVTAIAPHLSCLGISLDSSNVKTNSLIGRVSQKGNIMPVSDVVETIRIAREANPAISIKINTVVNAVNMQEDMSNLISLINPDRWKVMRVLPVITDALSISTESYSEFVNRHGALSAVMTVEDNQDMVDSYIMIDPLGRFFQNSLGGSAYLYSSPIQEVGIEKAFAQTGFSPIKFAKRYQSSIHGKLLP